MLKRIDALEIEKRKQFEDQTSKTQNTIDVVRAMKQQYAKKIWRCWTGFKFRKVLKRRRAARKILKIWRRVKRS
jgi:hypothetical protein